MDNKKIGLFIAELRKEKSMTQKALAEKLSVTDKAVSKWERGNGFPEITIIPAIADILEVSANELLAGQRNAQADTNPSCADEIVISTIDYIEKTNKRSSSTMVLTMISTLFLLALFVCILCDYAVSKKLDWSLYPAGALAVAWLIITPLIIFKKHKALWSFIFMTISVPPYLFLVEYLSAAKGWVVPLGLPIFTVSGISILIVIYLYAYRRIRKLFVLAASTFIFGVIVNLAVKKIVDHFLSLSHDNTAAIITAISCFFVSILLVLFGNARKFKVE